MSFNELQDFYNIIYSTNCKNNRIPVYFIKNIVSFWKSNKQIWFSHEEVHHFDMIQKKYKNCKYDNVALLLHYDQIFRHPSTSIHEKDKVFAYKFATQIAFRIIHSDQYQNSDSIEKVFTLLTIRHNKSLLMKMFALKKAFIELNTCNVNNDEEVYHEKTKNLWLRFIKASIIDIDNFKYNKGYLPINNTDDYINNVDKDIWFIRLREKYKNIFEEKKLIDNSFDKNKHENLFIQCVKNIIMNSDFNIYNVFAVSISGGVDSMILSYIANNVCKKYNKKLILLHICYNNRDCCSDEVSFLKDWANYLNVELYIREIDEIQRSRNSAYRSMYEEVTRRIRFSFYKYFDCPILLGHNRDDTIENMFSNLSKGIHFDNLSGMKEIGFEDTTHILRPFLSIDKCKIIQYADNLNIPHLYDSTPPWSRRGQTRDTLIPSINDFDPNILKGLEKFTQYTSFLYNQWEKQFEQWNKVSVHKCNSSLTITRDLYFNNNKDNISFWIRIWFDNDMDTRPSNKSFHNLIHNIRSDKHITCDMNKKYKCIITHEHIIFALAK